MNEKYLEFFELFHGKREYFQCHEILEEIWIDETSCTTKDHSAVVLLQFSVALLHWQRGNYKGALRVFATSLQHLENCIFELETIGVHSSKLKDEIENAMEEIQKEKPYRQIDIPGI